MTDYYLLNGQDQVGPYTGDQIAEMRDKGILGDSGYLWREGMAEWSTIGAAFAPGGELEDLASHPEGSLSAVEPEPHRKPPSLPDVNRALVVLESAPSEHVFNQNSAGPGYAPSPRPGGSSYPMAPPGNSPADDLIRCPYCGSTQFFGRRKVTSLGWTLYISALVWSVISCLAMTIGIGFCMIILSPILAITGFYGCQAHVNTCAKCKRDF